MFNYLYTNFLEVTYLADYSLTIVSITSVILGILVIISKNPIVSVIFLISLFLCISIYLILLGLNFIGLSYLLVYIGAVSILFLFILMLINIRVSELINGTYNNIFLSIIIAFSFAINVTALIPNSDLLNKLLILNKDNSNNSENISSIKSVYAGSWDNNMIDNSYIFSIGNVLYTNFSIWLILASIILLLAMVGCILITKKN